MNLRRFLQTGAGRASLLRRQATGAAVLAALPTTNLTAYFDAAVNTDLWQNYQAGTPFHNTAAADGSVVGAWQSTNGTYQWKTPADTARPTWRSATPLLSEPCLDFDPTSTPDLMHLYNAAGTVATPWSSLITNSAFVMVVAFLVESATANNAASYSNHAIIGDSGGYCGIFVRNNAGQLILQGFNWDTNERKVERNITVNTPHVACFRHAGGNIYLSVDGGSEATAVAANTGNVAGAVQMGTSLGANAYNGRIGGFAFYNADISAQDRSDAISAMSKWTV